MKNGKPYKYNSKDRIQRSPKKIGKKAKEETTQNTIKIDKTRLNDSKSLDTSFLEGRKEKKVNNNPKAKEKILKDSSKKIKKIRFFRNLFLSLSLVCIILLIGLYSYDSIKNMIDSYNSNHKKEEEVVKKKNDKIDDNYLFIGDYLTDEFNFEEFGYDYHYIKVSSRDNTTSNLLNNMKNSIYQYNPSIIFIELGSFDINNNSSVDEYISNLDNIVKLVHKNRPYATIYIESIYPINSGIEGFSSKYFGDSVTNELIKQFNISIEKYAKDNNVDYLDVYSLLVNKSSLDKTYTDNGYSLNKSGYQQVNKLIKKIVG